MDSHGFPVTTEQNFGLGVYIVRVPFCGWIEVCVMDDFGNLVPFSFAALAAFVQN